jgi:hypothetical protein
MFIMGIELRGGSSISKVQQYIKENKINGDRTSFDRDMWNAYGSEMSSYNASFEEVLEGTCIQDLVRDISPLVMVDIMGPSATTRKLFETFPNKEKLGIAVTLEDLRDVDARAADERNNIYQINADILKSSTWREIENKLAGCKANLVTARPLGGFMCLPHDY